MGVEVACIEVQRTLHPCVKHAGQSLAAMGAAGLLPSRLFYVTDNASGTRILIDTGSEVSVMPPPHTDHKHKQDTFTLQAVNNTTIATFGTRLLTLNLRLRRTFQ